MRMSMGPRNIVLWKKKIKITFKILQEHLSLHLIWRTQIIYLYNEEGTRSPD